jgi:hypothetical protein
MVNARPGAESVGGLRSVYTVKRGAGNAGGRSVFMASARPFVETAGGRSVFTANARPCVAAEGRRFAFMESARPGAGNAKGVRAGDARL